MQPVSTLGVITSQYNYKKYLHSKKKTHTVEHEKEIYGLQADTDTNFVPEAKSQET